jgi:hypothetical protein
VPYVVAGAIPAFGAPERCAPFAAWRVHQERGRRAAMLIDSAAERAYV